MTNFDVKVEKMQEEAMQKQNEAWNTWLLNSLQSRSKDEVLKSMFDLLIIPIGGANVLSATKKELVLA